MQLTKIVINDGGACGTDPDDWTLATLYLVDPHVGLLCELQEMVESGKHDLVDVLKFIDDHFKVAEIEKTIEFNYR